MRTVLYILCIMLTLMSCNKEQQAAVPDIGSDKCVSEFMLKNNLKIVPENEKDCIYYQAYKFEGQYFYELSCCVCDLVPQILKCNGEVFISSDMDDIGEFKAKAELLPVILVAK